MAIRLQGQVGMTGMLAATWWTRPRELGKCLEVPGRFSFTWDSFAYENGYEEPQIIEGVGSFTFEKHAYEAAINDAAAF